jgi:5'-phosphate synthase pdxT subunit
MTVGVLALQGDFALHRQALDRCRIGSVEVRRPEALERIDGLIIPGGESTTLLRLLEVDAFIPALAAFHGAGKPIFGTCAGLILLAREVENPRQPSLGLIDATVERNAYGRQRESFVAAGTATLAGEPSEVEMVFIRAPRIRHLGPGVTRLATLAGEPVLARQGPVLVATFHPELTADPTIHRYFARMVAGMPGPVTTPP